LFIMSQPRTTAVILGAAALIGLLADQLFRAPVWGINVPLAAAMLAAAGMAMPSRSERPRAPWSWLASLFFAAMWAVRDAPDLLAVNLLAALALASLPLLEERGIGLRAVDLLELALAPLRTAWAITFGTLQMRHAVRQNHFPGQIGGGNSTAIAMGGVLAVPLLLVFGTLFTLADPVFNRAVTSIFSDNLGPLVSHLFTAGALAWASAGYLWFLAKPAREIPSLMGKLPAFGGLQVVIPIFALVILFTFFVATQATSLFGGASFVETTTGLTFAEYARQGFFQLVFASMLVLPLVYLAPVLAGQTDERTTRRLRGLLMAQLALTGLVLLSALWRMRLYIQFYGLTEDRVNGTAMMLWIGATLAVFGFTVARGKPARAAYGSLIAAVATLAALNLANPQALIARYNLAHPSGREVDFAHLARVGGDAVPLLVAELEKLTPAQRCVVTTELRKRYVVSRGDWRGWNLARVRANDATRTVGPAGRCVVLGTGGQVP
jgi:hypothetical protein